MKKREPIDIFLGGLNEIRDQLTSIGATLDQELMVRTTLNAVSKDWEVFVQVYWAERPFHIGRKCGWLFAKKRSEG